MPTTYSGHAIPCLCQIPQRRLGQADDIILSQAGVGGSRFSANSGSVSGKVTIQGQILGYILEYSVQGKVMRISDVALYPQAGTASNAGNASIGAKALRDMMRDISDEIFQSSDVDKIIIS